jgi:shikimate kinase
LTARSNIILIGMPGAGKSTLGVLLAKELAKAFVDTDLHIQDAAGKTLQAIVDEEGYLGLRRLEEQALRQLEISNAVIATGGSAVYSDAAMAHLKSSGTCVYLELSLMSVEDRVNNMDSRGIAAAPGTTLADIYAERQPLYEKCADITLNCDNQTVEEILTNLKSLSL